MHLVINNLPRSECRKKENYLQPLVDELEKLFIGIDMKAASNTNVKIRAALLIVACDIPAARNVSGFTGFRSYYARHKCNMQLPALANNPTQRDSSNFDQDT